MKQKKIKTMIVVFMVMFLCYLFFFHYTEPTQIGVQRNLVTGEITLDIPGANFTTPWVQVSKIDTRPVRVCVTSAGRGFNCRLVQFEPEHFKEFIKTEGFYYWWWANRISFNIGDDEQYRGIKNLMRGYGYGLKEYKFITVLEEYSFSSQ